MTRYAVISLVKEAKAYRAKRYLAIFPIFCLLGFGLEWAYGVFWNIVGTTPWVYPNSALRYTSFEGIPLWGFGGLAGFAVYRAITDRSPKRLLGMVIPLILSALWILVYAQFIA